MKVRSGRVLFLTFIVIRKRGRGEDTMIIHQDGTIQYLTIQEHLTYGNIVYAYDGVIQLCNNKDNPFELVTPDVQYDKMYIDVWAMEFGFKEQLRRIGKEGIYPIEYGCPRHVRDEMLSLDASEVIEIFSNHDCQHQECQYWSNPTGMSDRRYAFKCLIAKYRAISRVQLKEGFTLEEIGRLLVCTRERVRQIEEKALTRLRHKVREDAVKGIHGDTLDYRAFSAHKTTDGIQ